MRNVALLVVGMIGCTRLDGPIAYRSAGGFFGGGTGISYRVELDGQMSFDSRDGHRDLVLDEALLARLTTAARGAILSHEEAAIACSDCFEDQIVIHSGGETRSFDIFDVVLDERFASQTPALAELVRATEAIAARYAGP